jgi:phosphate/sulfate permease
MDLFTIILVILAVLAVLDLTVGVSNDAVNFLNSSIGAKVAPRHVIMIIASLGILFGVTFSAGLMEVARKGIFNPGMFYMPEIMFIFLGVMLTDVLLLDSFNSLGLPTSTTVSIVFELLGAAVAMAMIKTGFFEADAESIAAYINSAQALIIIGGIFLSVFVAFNVGAIIQFITRLLFTFDYEERVKKYGALFGGIALTSILYFIMIKGAKGASFMTSENKQWILDNTILIMAINFVFWTLFLAVWQRVSKFHILRIVVLVGTFALAMAFAANDLVNFIGVPLAALSAHTIANATADPTGTLMSALAEPVTSNTILLLLAGVIMVVTLWLSRKARTVTQTEINLARQEEGKERFGSSKLSRAIVLIATGVFTAISKILPPSTREWVNMRLTTTSVSFADNPDRPAFDMLRASVNLTVASALISLATSLKLPLSTTYVTFMVAMGTSLSDRAWGKESAAQRVNGVLTVVGGWFVTAMVAFLAAFLMTTIVYYGGIYAVIILVIFAFGVVYHFYKLHRKRENDSE